MDARLTRFFLTEFFNKMKTTTYNFILSPGSSKGLYWAQLLPVKAYGQIARAVGAKDNLAVFDTNGSTKRFYTVDQEENERPLSAMYFWFDLRGVLYGEILSTNLMVKAEFNGDIDRCHIEGEAVCLDVTVIENSFNDAEGLYEKSIIGFDPWKIAQRMKTHKTSFLSLYNNHNFYTINENEDK